MTRVLAISILFGFLTPPVVAQSLSPEDIARMLDEEEATPNPYLALLNDPDPTRSRSAMRIMLGSGDPELQQIALEAGLLAADEQVRHAAVEYYLRSEPSFRVIFDGTATDSGRFVGEVGSAGAIVDSERQAFATWTTGAFNEVKNCYLWADRSDCAFRIQREGIFLFDRRFDGRLAVNDEGDLVGMLRMDNVDDRIPITIRFLD